MKKIIYMVFLCCICTQMQAQEYADLIRKNPAMAAANMTNYNFEDCRYTPAPKGYKAFYISHYGRHGSRYQSNDRYAGLLWPVLRKADSLNLLSEAGKAFYKDFNAVIQEQCGMYGMLTALGAKEQRGIAKRMASKFSEVFKGRNGRTEIFCQSSTSAECIRINARETVGKIYFCQSGTAGKRILSNRHHTVRYRYTRQSGAEVKRIFSNCYKFASFRKGYVVQSRTCKGTFINTLHVCRNAYRM